MIDSRAHAPAAKRLEPDSALATGRLSSEGDLLRESEANCCGEHANRRTREVGPALGTRVPTSANQRAQRGGSGAGHLATGDRADQTNAVTICQVKSSYDMVSR